MNFAIRPVLLVILRIFLSLPARFVHTTAIHVIIAVSVYLAMKLPTLGLWTILLKDASPWLDFSKIHWQLPLSVPSVVIAVNRQPFAPIVQQVISSSLITCVTQHAQLVTFKTAKVALVKPVLSTATHAPTMVTVSPATRPLTSDRYHRLLAVDSPFQVISKLQILADCWWQEVVSL